MKCRTAIRRISPSLDGRLRGEALQQLQKHLENCPECELHLRQLSIVRGSMRELPIRKPPRQLTAALRLIASRERIHRLRRRSMGSSLEYWSELLRLWANNLMRPVALPITGGLISAVFLFNMLAPMYAHQEHYFEDVPTILSTKPALKSSISGFVLSDNDIIVDVSLDKEGRMIDYVVPIEQVWDDDPEMRKRIENTLICTRFTPATIFGQPIPSTLRITLRRSQVEVRG